MKISFLGAARTVTGSMHLLEVNGARILLDCGLYQGRRAEANERNRHLPRPALDADCLILSHAHIDHSGNIPGLCRQGFSGPIYATRATQDLCAVMLADSAHIQEQDAAYLNKKLQRRGEPLVEPIYTTLNAQQAMSQFVGVDYGVPFEPVPGVSARFLDAGHILGSAAIVLDVDEGGKNHRFCFTGDVGRPNTPIIRDPEPLEGVEWLVTESTYGNRLHDPIGDAEAQLADTVNETARRGGKVIIPAFSVGRTQELVYALARLRAENRIPEIPIFVDSPLSTNVTGVFRKHPECFDQEMNALLAKQDDPFGFSKLAYTRSVADSKQIKFLADPCIIISASGMCETGRILHHLSNNIGDPKNTVLIVGFQAANTLGRRLVEKWPQVRIFGEEHRVRAQVRVINALSAHADRDELLRYIGATQETLRKVFVVHGEESQSLALADTLFNLGIPEVAVPALGETHTL